MAKVKSQTIAGGAWVEVRIDGTPVGLASNVNFSEDFRVQPIEVLNTFGVFEYESFGYTCQLQMQWFIAKDKADFDRLIPKRSDIQADGLMPEHLLELIDTALGTVHQAFRGVVLATVGSQIQANQFITGDVSFFAKERI
jgi:hypothetical protein